MRPSADHAAVRALDGLRGLAVTAVVVNHLRPNALPGGWLGVDVFFVLSGYLITSLLLTEHAATGRISLRRFYARRGRRLLPALFLLLAVLAVAARAAPGAPGFADLRVDGFAALGYVANWRFALTGTSYFGAFAPSPLRHLWSLSVEEQFYLLWPLLVVVTLRRSGTRVVGWVALGLAAGSATAMAFTYGSGMDVSRAYFGTDTHAHGVLLGCALAALGPSQRFRRYQPIATSLALVGIGLGFALLDGTSAAAYRGGIAIVGVLATVAIAGIVAPGGAGPARPLLESVPLRGLGRISYGVYLWHWPVLIFVNAARTGVSGWSLVAIQIALTLTLAVASYLFLERPVLLGWPHLRWSWIGAAAGTTLVALALTIVVPRTVAPFTVAQHQARARAANTARLPALAPAGHAGSAPVVAGPRRVLVVGDSVAYTLFPGFRTHEHASGLYFLTAAQTGCPLDIAAVAYRYDDSPQPPLDLPAYCDWPRVWPPIVDRTRPDVVVALWGLWDLFDHEVDGVWLSVGSSAWKAHMEQVLDHALDIVTARHGRMIVLTTPYVFGFAHARVDALNEVYRTEAARRPDRLTVIEIQSAMERLRPARWDDVHFAAPGADALGGVVVPEIAHIARRAGARRAS